MVILSDLQDQKQEDNFGWPLSTSQNHAKVNLVGEGFLVLSDPCEMCFLYS